MTHLSSTASTPPASRPEASAALRETLEREVLDAYEKEYERHYERLTALDAKAMGLAGSAGIFLAAVFAFVGDDRSVRAPGPVFWGVIVSLSLLSSTILLCLMAYRMQKFKIRLPGDYVHQLVTDVLRMDAPESSLEGYRGELRRYWADAIASLHVVARRKARWLGAAQWTLIAAATAVAVTTVLSIL